MKGPGSKCKDFAWCVIQCMDHVRDNHNNVWHIPLFSDSTSDSTSDSIKSSMTSMTTTSCRTLVYLRTRDRFCTGFSLAWKSLGVIMLRGLLNPGYLFRLEKKKLTVPKHVCVAYSYKKHRSRWGESMYNHVSFYWQQDDTLRDVSRKSRGSFPSTQGSSNKSGRHYHQ